MSIQQIKAAWEAIEPLDDDAMARFAEKYTADMLAVLTALCDVRETLDAAIAEKQYDATTLRTREVILWTALTKLEAAKSRLPRDPTTIRRGNRVWLVENGNYWLARWVDASGHRAGKSLGPKSRISKKVAIQRCRALEDDLRQATRIDRSKASPALDRIDRGNEVGIGLPSPVGDSSGNPRPMPAMSDEMPAIQGLLTGRSVHPMEVPCPTSGDVGGCRNAADASTALPLSPLASRATGGK